MPFLVFVLMMANVQSPTLTVPIFQIVEASELSTSTLKQMATEIATAHKLNVYHFLATVTLESNWDINAIGDQGHSFGLVQIYLPAHPDISKEQALNPKWALEWMASEWGNDRAYIWSGWCILFGTPSSKCPSELLR